MSSGDWNSLFVSASSGDSILVFSKSASSKYSFRVNDILVSSEGEGLLRRITAVEENAAGLTLHTTQASIAEAVGDGEGSFTVQFPAARLNKAEVHDSGLRLLHPGKPGEICFPVDEVLYDEDGNPATRTDQITLTGSCSFIPEMVVDKEVESERAIRLKVETAVRMNLNLTLSINLSAIEYSGEKSLGEVEIGTLPATLCGLPLKLTPVLEVVAGAAVDVHSKTYTRVKQDLKITAGFLYENGTWSRYSRIDSSFSYTPPSVKTSAKATAYIKPSMSVKIDKVVSPYLYFSLYGDLEADVQASPWWELYAGVAAGGGVKMKIWDWTIADFGATLMDYRVKIAEAAAASEVPVLDVTPLTLDFGPEATFLELQIRNAGTGTLSWSISDDMDWCYFFTKDGSATTETDIVRINIDRGLLPGGLYSGILNVTSNGGDQAVQVRMEVEIPYDTEMEWVSIHDHLTFTMGDSWGDGYDDQLPVHQVTLSPYSMGMYEVTNAQYCEFLNEALAQGLIRVFEEHHTTYAGPSTASGAWIDLDTGYADTSGIGYGNGRFRVRSGMGYHPVVAVSSDGAAAFADHYGWRLPTEAEWERAARGPDPGRKWPWGDSPPAPDKANFKDSNLHGTVPVGTYPQGRSAEGIYDLSGNVSEWCSDYYQDHYEAEAQVDPTGPANGLKLVCRGGHFDYLPHLIRTTYRGYLWEGSQSWVLGFRVAKSD
ncbi:SUMF1/EgtB/PvdO family nonheme iron enzyme [bacterium]|nr:SUMF1/EgtB/PvdO family nonheme iron enzyme [bacterium]